MKKIIAYIITIIVLICPIVANAETVPVTKENLTKALEDLKTWTNTPSENQEEESTKITSYTVSDSTIEIETNIGKFSLTYSIEQDGKVIFKNSQKFTNNMSYDDYQKKTEELQNGLWGYILVAYIEGASFEDAATYYMFAYLNYALEILGSQSGDVPFVVVETTNDPNVSVEFSDTMEINGKKVPVIKKEDFPSRSLEYALYSYSNPSNFNDNKEGYLYSFENKTSASDKTNEYITVDAVLTVDSTKDYTQLKTINEKMIGDMKDSFGNMFGNLNDSLTEEPKEEVKVENTTTTEATVTPEVKKDEIENPQTGVIVPSVVILSGLGIIVLIRNVTSKNKLHRI